MTFKLLAAATAVAATLCAYPALTATADATKGKPSQDSTVSKDDQRFFERLAQGNLAEIESGELAQKKAVSAEVRKFAEHMVSDHGRMLDEQRSMATANGPKLPTASDKDHPDTAKRLASDTELPDKLHPIPPKK